MANKKVIPELMEIRYPEYFKLYILKEANAVVQSLARSTTLSGDAIILMEYFLLPLKEPNRRVKEKCCQVRVQPEKFHTPRYSALSKYGIEPR